MEIIDMYLSTVTALLAYSLSTITVLPCQASLLTSVQINTKEAAAEVNERFLSLTLDSGIIRHRWDDWDFRSKRLRTLASGLSPCYLRLGGTAADFLIFNPQENMSNGLNKVKYHHMKVHDMQLDSCDGWRFCKPKNTTKFTMTGEDWDNINRFATDVGWKMLFDFNVLLARGSKWSPTNAKLLLQYTAKKEYAGNIDFELGNEPNAFLHNFNRSLSGRQLGADFLVLKDLLKNTNFSRSSLVGPDVTRPRAHSKSVRFLKDFLQKAGSVITAVTWHQYYINGRTAVLDNFTDPAVLDLLKNQIHVVKDVVKHKLTTKKKIWLGETSSAWGGGAKGLSDSYVAGFMWLDKLGLAATGGIDMAMRQSFVRGHYALLDDNLQPRPDYWLSLLYKQLVGTRVLKVTVADKSGKIRFYAHCTAASPRQRLVPRYLPGSVTVYGMNLYDTDVTLSNFDNMEVHQYLLLPHTNGKLRSHLVRLNGKKLKMIDDTTFPSLRPRILKPGRPPIIPGKSFGFFVVPHARAAACV